MGPSRAADLLRAGLISRTTATTATAATAAATISQPWGRPSQGRQSVPGYGPTLVNVPRGTVPYVPMLGGGPPPAPATYGSFFSANERYDDMIGERVRQILAERDREPMSLRPFVLKCQNCIAPVESGATHCTYCEAPLVWEPERSLSKDDFHMRSAAPSSSSEMNRPDRSVLGIGPHVVHGDTTTMWSHAVQEPFRPTRLYIEPRCAENFVIEDIRIGYSSLRRNTDSIPAQLCAQGDGIDLFENQVLTPGIMLVIHFKNLSAAHTTLSGAIRGIVLP